MIGEAYRAIALNLLAEREQAGCVDNLGGSASHVTKPGLNRLTYAAMIILR